LIPLKLPTKTWNLLAGTFINHMVCPLFCLYNGQVIDEFTIVFFSLFQCWLLHLKVWDMHSPRGITDTEVKTEVSGLKSPHLKIGGFYIENSKWPSVLVYLRRVKLGEQFIALCTLELSRYPSNRWFPFYKFFLDLNAWFNHFYKNC
jgi:hypothetical protein